jgi:hypothetical protein
MFKWLGSVGDVCRTGCEQGDEKGVSLWERSWVAPRTALGQFVFGNVLGMSQYTEKLYLHARRACVNSGDGSTKVNHEPGS